jgi:GNAT superfamily N-acetyltransferase
MNNLHFHSLHSHEILSYLDVIGGLRLRVFFDYPYLYDGSPEEETSYLRTYADAQSSLVVLAMDATEAVGVTTCVRMSDGDAAFRSSFEQAGYDTSLICYFGESVLLPVYRGRGIGKAFFQYREAHARSLGCQIAAFCAVDRPEDHPQRPADYRPLDGFWQSLGYEKHPELQAAFVWKEVHDVSESPKTLTFWLKNLAHNPCQPLS